MADAATPSAAPDTEAAKRQKEQFDKLLARPAACSSGSLRLTA